MVRIDDDELSLILGRTEIIEEWATGGFQRIEGIEAGIDHQRGLLDPRKEVEGVKSLEGVKS